MSKSPAEIVADFGDFFAANPITDFRDVSVLPHPKKVILDSFYTLINEENDKDELLVLLKGVQLITLFQESVGDQPLYVLGFDSHEIKSVDEMNKDDVLKLANRIANNQNSEKIEYFREMAQKEEKVIQEKISSILDNKKKETKKSNTNNIPQPPSPPSRWRYFIPAFMLSFAGLWLLKGHFIAENYPNAGITFASFFIALLYVETFGRFQIWIKSKK